MRSLMRAFVVKTESKAFDLSPIHHEFARRSTWYRKLYDMTRKQQNHINY